MAELIDLCTLLEPFELYLTTLLRIQATRPFVTGKESSWRTTTVKRSFDGITNIKLTHVLFIFLNIAPEFYPGQLITTYLINYSKL